MKLRDLPSDALIITLSGALLLCAGIAVVVFSPKFIYDAVRGRVE
jgi:hypothetical protein